METATYAPENGPISAVSVEESAPSLPDAGDENRRTAVDLDAEILRVVRTRVSYLDSAEFDATAERVEPLAEFFGSGPFPEIAVRLPFGAYVFGVVPTSTGVAETRLSRVPDALTDRAEYLTLDAGFFRDDPAFAVLLRPVSISADGPAAETRYVFAYALADGGEIVPLSAEDARYLLATF